MDAVTSLFVSKPIIPQPVIIVRSHGEKASLRVIQLQYIRFGPQCQASLTGSFGRAPVFGNGPARIVSSADSLIFSHSRDIVVIKVCLLNNPGLDRKECAYRTNSAVQRMVFEK